MPSIRFIHCADLHLDSRMESRLSPSQAQNRRQELLQTFSRMADYAHEHQIRAILISGDLFDTVHVSSAAVQTVLHCIKKYPEVDFLYLPGNHDSNAMFQFIQHAAPDNLWIFKDSDSETSQNDHIILQKSYGNILITGLTGSAGKLPPLSASRINIVMLHGQICSHRIDSGNADPLSASDSTIKYSLKDFEGKNIDYIAAGHIHQFQSRTIDNRGYFCYSGCLEGRGFDECGEKGFVLLTVNPEAVFPEAVFPKAALSFQFVPFAFRTLCDLEMDVSELTDYTQAEEKADILLSGIDGTSLIRLRLKGQLSPQLLPQMPLHADWIFRRYAGDFYFFHVEDMTGPAVSYEDYRYDISLKGEFIRTVLSAKELTEEDKSKVIMEGLRVLSGEEILLGS
ncbi:MAG: DNA repair exonuclease [Lachnospiraceae bacterium]|nr:DNA repair exonuclease [Lachnospiraceae bacterium]